MPTPRLPLRDVEVLGVQTFRQLSFTLSLITRLFRTRALLSTYKPSKAAISPLILGRNYFANNIIVITKGSNKLLNGGGVKEIVLYSKQHFFSKTDIFQLSR